jgi:hypothetical protein
VTSFVRSLLFPLTISCGVVAAAFPDSALVATETPALPNVKLVSEDITFPIEDCSVVVVLKSPVPDADTKAIPTMPVSIMPTSRVDLRLLLDALISLCMVL